MEKKKRIIAICIAVALAIITIVLIAKLISIKNNKEKEVANTNESSIQSNVVENNIMENNTIENNVIENSEIPENTVIDNEKKPSENNTNIGKEEITKTEIEKEKSNKEKAMEIVKKDWGEDNSVYFSFEGIENGKYIISVREEATTRTVNTYAVNVESETFTKDQ